MTKTIAVKPTRKLPSGSRTVHARHDAVRHEDEAGGDAESVQPTFFSSRRPPARSAAQPTHRFRVGERLALSGSARVLSRSGLSCRITALLPYEGRGALLYRVRSESEQFERVVPESDLTR